jgi:pimeloyl-ACP methyl ester carboxylesterase
LLHVPTYVLIHGAGDRASCWDLLRAELRARGHEVVTMDLPSDDPSAGLWDYVDTVVEAIGGRTDLIVVAQSMGGFIAPLVCTRVSVELVVLVAGMVPRPGERGKDYWANTGYDEAVRERGEGDDSPIALFYHDVPPALAREALSKGRSQAETPMQEPWPLATWPNVPTRYLLCRDDRVFPAEWIRRLVRERLGIEPDEIDGGHCPFLSRPKELAERLEAYRTGR